MRTSIVDHFCASLSDAIVGDVDLQGFDMLDRLETGDLFLVPLDPEHEWYRYHHLFRDFLRDRLAHQSPALIPELHMRASHWFAELGRMYAAIEEALAAGSPDRAATLIDSLGCRLALEGSDAQTLGWIEQIPEPLHRHHPWLRVAQLNALCGMERYDRLMPLIESIEADLGLFPGLPIATCVLLVRAWCTMRTRYEPQMLLRYGLQAREQLAGLPDSDANGLLRAMAEAWLAYDTEDFYNQTAHFFFAEAESPYEALGTGKGKQGFDIDQIADAVAAVHLVHFQPADPQRLNRAREHLLAMIEQSRLCWEHALAEKDDDREWIPNADQTSLTPLTVDEERIAAWKRFLDEAEAVLQGDKLLPHWRVKDGRGINLKRVFEEPRTFDLVLWAHGAAAVPYLEEGELVTRETARSLSGAFQGRFLAFAVGFQ